MKLPIPNAEHVTKMQDLYFAEFGVQLTRQEAFEALSHITHFYYLTQYAPLHSIRTKESGGRGKTATIDSGSGATHDADRRASRS